MKRKIRVGDLVRYNAAGMKYKTLGIVWDEYIVRRIGDEAKRVILIHWVVTDKLLPRTSNAYYYHVAPADAYRLTWQNIDPATNPTAWYDDKSYLEVANI